MRRELSIGVAEGRAELMFGSVVAVAASVDGTIYVADRSPLVVRAFSPEGDYLGELGREGQGPGEYGRIAGLAAHPDGGVVVWDHGNQRLMAFSDDGQVAWSSLAQSSFVLDGLSVGAEGVIYLAASEGQVGDTSRRYLMRRYTAGGEADGEIDLPSAEPAVPGYMVLHMIRGEIASFERGTLRAWSPLGYLISGRNDQYSITVDAPDRAVVLERDVTPAVIAEGERAEVQELIEGTRARFAAMGREVRADPVPEAKPYFRGIDLGRDGRIWLRRYTDAILDASVPESAPDDQPVRRWFEPTVYDIWEPDGTFLGSLRFPDGVAVREMRGELVWATETDVDGVERVIRLRVVPAG